MLLKKGRRGKEMGSRGRQCQARRNKGRLVITHHNHFAVLNFSNKICFFAIPFLYVNKFVPIQANNRLRPTKNAEHSKRYRLDF